MVPSQLSSSPTTTQYVPRSLELSGFAWMAVANVLFAVMSISARFASRSAPWAMVGASRAGVGALVALAFALRTGASLKTKSMKLSLARSAFGTVSMVLTFYALGQPGLAVGDAATLFATAPLFIAMLAPMFLGERVDSRLWGLLVAAFFGAALIAGPHLASEPVPAIAALCAALFSAFAMMFLRLMRSGRGAGEPESSEAIALHFAVFSFIVHVALSLSDLRVPTLVDCFFLALTGLSGGLAQLAMTRAYALAEAPKLGATSYLGPVLSFLGAILFLGERPRLMQLGGVMMVIGAGIMLALSAARGPSKSAPKSA